MACAWRAQSLRNGSRQTSRPSARCSRNTTQLTLQLRENVKFANCDAFMPKVHVISLPGANVSFSPTGLGSRGQRSAKRVSANPRRRGIFTGTVTEPSQNYNLDNPMSA